MSTAHVEKENEYFAREDAERIFELAHPEALERQRQKLLHWMRCPRCGMQLREVRYRDISVDACHSCHGIFLDEGDLAHIQKPEHAGVMSGILNWLKLDAH